MLYWITRLSVILGYKNWAKQWYVKDETEMNFRILGTQNVFLNLASQKNKLYLY